MTKDYKGSEGNFRFEMLQRELNFLRDFIEGIEDSIDSAVENYKGSILESERVRECRVQHPSSIFVEYSDELIDYVLNEFKGKTYEVEGVEGVSVVVKSIKYNEPVESGGVSPEFQERQPNNVKMVLGVIEERS